MSCHCGHDLRNKEDRKYFISGVPRSVGGYKLVDITFDKASRSNSEYPGADTVPTQRSYFPQWPVVRGIANYKVPKPTMKNEADLCLKYV